MSRKGLRVIRCPSCVCGRLLLAIGAEGVEGHELGRRAGMALERELRTPQHVLPRLGGWASERKACVETAQGVSGSTSRESPPTV